MKYRRILLKLSGEALGDHSAMISKRALNDLMLLSLAKAIATLVCHGVQVGLVLGGGNWFRGIENKKVGITRITGDQIGMLATTMNALVLRDKLFNERVNTAILSALPIASIVEPFETLKAKHYLQQGKVVIFAGGTGHPFVSTDSAASLRALEIEADILLKATSVDGVYNADPYKNKEATCYHELTYDQVIRDELNVMDLSAFIQCRDHQLPIRVFNIKYANQLLDIVKGKAVGTLISA